MPSYRQRLAQDLDGWIGEGLVPPENRAAILASVGEGRRLDAATALGIIGGLLAGVAVIAFVAANWAEIPRIARFGLILGAFAAVCGGGAWAQARGRPIVAQVALSVAALIFAAAIGLTGQIFDLTGDPATALRSAAVAAGLLALAGRSAWPGAIALAFLCLAEAFGMRLLQEPGWPWWTGIGALAGAGLALQWRSQALAHAAGIASWIAFAGVMAKTFEGAVWPVFAWAVVWIGLAVTARRLRDTFAPASGTLYGWWTWIALGQASVALARLLGLSGADDDQGVPFSLAMMVLSAALVALGRYDRHGGVTAVGVFGLFGAGGFLLLSLGVGLLTAAAVFAGCAVAAMVAALLLRRRKAA